MAEIETDAWDHPAASEFTQHVMDELITKMERSALAVTIWSGSESDVKLAVETGVAVLMDKPMIVVVAPGVEVPAKLRLIADEIVEFDPDHPERLQQALSRVLGRIDAQAHLKRVREGRDG